MFVGRVSELNELARSYNGVGAHVFELYAPRNAGKTTLLEEFCRNKATIFFTAADENGRTNLAKFSKLVLERYRDKVHNPFIFWSEALSYIADKQDGKRIIVVIDNADELADRDAVFIDMLCKCVLSSLKDKNILLILSGRRKMLPGLLTDMNEKQIHKVSTSLRLSKFVLNDDVIDKITAGISEEGTKAKVFRCSEDNVILREGEVNTEMYKILAGRAVMYFGYGTDDEYAAGTLKEGQCFGEYSLLTGKPGICTVMAYSDMLLLRISDDEFSRFVEMNTSNSVEIMRKMAKVISIMKANIDMLREEISVKA